MVIQSESEGKEGERKSEKGHTEGSPVWDGEIRKTEGGKRRQWVDGRVRYRGWVVGVWSTCGNDCLITADMYKCYCLEDRWWLEGAALQNWNDWTREKSSRVIGVVGEQDWEKCHGGSRITSLSFLLSTRRTPFSRFNLHLIPTWGSPQRHASRQLTQSENVKIISTCCPQMTNKE